MSNRFQARGRCRIAAAIVVALLTIGLGLLSCSSQRYAGRTESITIGTTTSEANSLILIAQDQGYFAANGIDVTVKIYASGRAAIDAMFNREVDMATGSEFAFAGRVPSRDNIRAIAVISRSEGEYLVGRVDKGIRSISDLRGKRIGVPLKSRPEFSLDRFLYLRGIDDSEVTLVDTPVDQSVEALVSGTVDAVTAWEPYTTQMRDRMGDGLVVWSTQEEQPSYTLVMSTDGWTAENPELIARFLESLIEAESYNASHSGLARAVVQKKLGYTDAYIARVWPGFHFSVSLDQSLIVAMEDQARWMIKKDLTSANRLPNFFDYIYEDGLKAVKPGAVNIIR